MTPTAMRRNTSRRLGLLLEKLAPWTCRLCGVRSDTDYALCSVCREELIRNRNPCGRCALPLPAPAPATPGDGQRLCPDCQAAPPLISRVTAPFVYDAALRWLIGRWKYRREQSLAHTFAELWLWAVQSPPPIDYLMPIPLYWRRHLWRGFNQSADLQAALATQRAQCRGWRQPGPRLRRKRAGGAQARAGRGLRRRQLQDAFHLRGDIAGRRIALVDDVCTTGSTANAAAAVLLHAGAQEVQLWCIARTPRTR